MPLIQGKSPKSFSSNVSSEMSAGKPQKQALAIAYAIKRRNRKSKGGMAQNPKLEQSKMAEGGMVERPAMMQSKMARGGMIDRLIEKKMKGGMMYADGGMVGDVDEVDGLDELNDDLDRPLGGMGHVDEGDAEFENDPALTDNELGISDDANGEMKMRKGILAKLLRHL